MCSSFNVVEWESLSLRLVEEVENARKALQGAGSADQKDEAATLLRRSVKRLSDWTLQGTLPND
jgi:hypothetical protein